MSESIETVIVGGGQHDGHHILLGWLLGDRSPRRTLLAHRVQLFLDRIIGDRTNCSRHPESLRARQLDFRLHLEMELEGEWLSFRELHVVDVRLRGELHLGIANDLLVGHLNERFDRFLTNGIAEPLPDHRRRRFPGPEAGQSRGRGIAAHRLLLRLAHHVGWHLDLQEPFDAVNFLFGDLEIHQRVCAFNGVRRGLKRAL